MTDRDTINRVLAERVMGWTMGNISTKVEPDKNLDVWRDSNWSHIVFANVWDPMDNIAQAMMVERKLGEKGYYLKLTSPFYPGQPYWAYFELHGHTDTHPSFVGSGSKDSTAISRAAYEVVKGEK